MGSAVICTLAGCIGFVCDFLWDRLYDCVLRNRHNHRAYHRYLNVYAKLSIYNAQTKRYNKKLYDTLLDDANRKAVSWSNHLHPEEVSIN
jgi:hypothetical protein